MGSTPTVLNMRWVIVHGIFSNKNDAVKCQRRCQGKVRNPSVVYREKSNSWVVELFASDDRNKIDEARSWYIGHGIEAYVQEVQEVL